MKADFHLHTHCSDGTLPPAELLAAIRAEQLDRFAVTDHDSLAGYQQLRHQPGIIAGVEITAGHDGREIHVVALGVNPDDATFNAFLAGIRAKRHERFAILFERLPANRRKGLTIADALDPVSESPSRMHLARMLVNRGMVRSINDAFERWLGDEYAVDGNLPAFPPIAETAAVVRAAGGVALLAHPGVYGDAAAAERLTSQGLDGLEVDHPGIGADRHEHLVTLAKSRNWLMSAGSDLHYLGMRKPGKWSLSDELWKPLMERLKN